jgi:hypothetical protein
MGAYSKDLRLKVLAAVDRGDPQQARLDLQKKTLGASERDEEERSAWRERLSGVDPKRLVFVDECSTNVRMVPLRARASKGERAFGKAPRRTGRRT